MHIRVGKGDRAGLARARVGSGRGGPVRNRRLPDHALPGRVRGGGFVLPLGVYCRNGSGHVTFRPNTIALLAGGAVKGGRVIADWPGLKPANLYQGRDLAPSTDLRAVMKGVLKDQFGLAERVLAESVFPDSGAVKPMQGLVG